mmetsp:Transcript_25864/g.54232  ORF Transcript_25864/g.54232 Transcript_25864/m.54232 type:complete len:389 (+) Transcript_25864:753-1919(+)
MQVHSLELDRPRVQHRQRRAVGNLVFRRRNDGGAGKSERVEQRAVDLLGQVEAPQVALVLGALQHEEDEGLDGVVLAVGDDPLDSIAQERIARRRAAAASHGGSLRRLQQHRVRLLAVEVPGLCKVILGEGCVLSRRAPEGPSLRARRRRARRAAAEHAAAKSAAAEAAKEPAADGRGRRLGRRVRDDRRHHVVEEAAEEVHQQLRVCWQRGRPRLRAARRRAAVPLIVRQAVALRQMPNALPHVRLALCRKATDEQEALKLARLMHQRLRGGVGVRVLEPLLNADGWSRRRWCGRRRRLRRAEEGGAEVGRRRRRGDALGRRRRDHRLVGLKQRVHWLHKRRRQPPAHSIAPFEQNRTLLGAALELEELEQLGRATRNDRRVLLPVA